MIDKGKQKASDPSNYRPISLTSCLSKFVEGFVKDRLNYFLTSNNLICFQQSDFRNQRSTHDNLLFLTQKISENFNRNKKTCLILFDICKAFDKTWHFGILHKLLQLKVPLYLTKWIKSFLSHRLFCVKVNEAISDFEEISIGVPQGATLSPLLFSIFINDIPKPDKNLEIFHFCLQMILVVLFHLKNRVTSPK